MHRDKTNPARGQKASAGGALYVKDVTEKQCHSAQTGVPPLRSRRQVLHASISTSPISGRLL